MNKLRAPSLVILLLTLTTLSYAPQEARLLRFPTVSNDAIAFSCAGDLYTVPLAGGVARKLTSYAEGYEAFARFSPDGASIAFTGEYDGNREVYLIPASGGAPRRLTYTPSLGRDDISDRMGPNNLVMGWTPDGANVVFRSRMAEWNDFNGQLYLVPKAGGRPAQLPLPRGGFCSFSPDGTKLAYNRIFREFRTWKRYRGGMADDVWIYDFAAKTVENITANPALDIIPMWSGNRIYFVSDRDEAKRANLYVYDLAAKETRKLTDFTEFDIKFPSLGPKSIVFENGGYIYNFDLASEKAVRVPVIIADDQVSARGGVLKVGGQVTNYEIGPDGQRALFGAHGDVFTVPAKNGNTRNLTATPGIHERNSKWSPDGRTIAFFSDRSGQDEIWLMNADGTGEPRPLTTGGDTYKYNLLWSPDGSKILWDDKMLRLSCVDVATKAVTVVVTAKAGEIGRFSWSPDSRWIAYDRPDVDTPNRVYLYSLDSGKTFPVTDAWYNSYGPSFSRDGKYLFFVSDRDFNPVFSQTEYDHAYLAMSRVYFVTLAKDTKSPFAPKSDEVEVKPAKAAAPAPAAKTEAKPAAKTGPEAVAPVKVDADGLMDRLVALPIETANYGGVNAVGDSVYYGKFKPGAGGASLMFYDLAELKEKDLGSFQGYEISADGKKMLVGKDGGYAIIDLPKAPITLESKLDLSGLDVLRDRRQEWDQIYEECWRQMKEFFYAPNMHGVDWDALRLKYLPLAAAAHHRADLTYVIGELIGELSSGHTYVGGGDMPAAPKVKVGMLGAKLERDAKTGFYRIARILKGLNWDRSVRSPLTELGVDVKEGEYIVAANGRSLDKVADISEALYNTVGRQVTLKVAPAADGKNARDVVVLPVETENSLYYNDWVEANIAKVDRATGGRVGYIHIPNMGVDGLNEFVRRFYPQLRKKALIVDVRGNGGGSVSPMIIDRLVREMVMVEVGRNQTPGPDPGAAFIGPKVCLCDEFSASDGDIFPYRFKTLKLGPVIGKRTWGGVVGIRGTLPLLDGGSINKPEFAPYSPDGKGWIIEGRGVEPDIVVDNDPAREFAGLDDQLNKGIEVVLEQLKVKGREIPPVPPYPIKK
ncbi:MAG TPA: PDZ domain-containing protein [Candidatus Aminicenantes bacterium]|nr:PDZ domain-containing protein [Candidatus Aminicenantes bacterium]HRY66214.1 PDZ domain-containing protein [Candidatus Aminicenantes bacterium]HRZ73128.1 PDZ domain-containing protein [Candidatus Aminicenantes bacterium]